MTLRTVVLPLGFGLSAVLCVSAATADDEPAPRPPVRVYTNEDLERVRPFRDETGIRSVPAVTPDDRPASPATEKRRGRGEEYWRREAARVRERIQAMEARASELRAEIAEQAEAASRATSGRRRSSASLSGGTSSARTRARLASLERRMRQMEEELADRARRDGALPGWLRQ